MYNKHTYRDQFENVTLNNYQKNIYKALFSKRPILAFTQGGSNRINAKIKVELPLIKQI